MGDFDVYSSRWWKTCSCIYGYVYMIFEFTTYIKTEMENLKLCSKKRTVFPYIFSLK